MKSRPERNPNHSRPRSAADFLARRPAVVPIIALAVFAIVAAAVLDDYGVWVDEAIQRRIGYASFDYALGDEDALIKGHSDKYYGVAFEVALVAAELLLGLEDSHAVYLSPDVCSRICSFSRADSSLGCWRIDCSEAARRH